MILMRFIHYYDKYNGQLHAFNQHGVTQEEIEVAFIQPVRQYKDESAFIRICKAKNGELMEIVFVWNKPNQEAFIITAYYV